MNDSQDNPEDASGRLYSTALRVLLAVLRMQSSATNHLEWIAEEAGVSDSTASRWLNLMARQERPLVEPYEQDWIWGDPHRYWRVTTDGEQHIAAATEAGLVREVLRHE